MPNNTLNCVEAAQKNAKVIAVSSSADSRYMAP